MTGYTCLYGYSPAPGIEFRCRRCLPCRRARRACWYGRLLLEFQDVGVGSFATLTYADDPGLLTDKYRHLQLLFKRLRHSVQFRYFAIADYGDKFGRGHWHLLLFGPPPDVVLPLLQAHWGHGFSHCSNMARESIGYCSRYVLHFETEGDKTYSRQSVGIGLDGIRRLAQEVAASGHELGFWPSRFRAGDGAYPLIDGARAAFQKAYLAAGGSPPRFSDPDRLHASAEAVYRSNPDEYYALVGARLSAFEGSRLARKGPAKVHIDRYKDVLYGLPAKKK